MTNYYMNCKKTGYFRGKNWNVFENKAIENLKIEASRKQGNGRGSNTKENKQSESCETIPNSLAYKELKSRNDEKHDKGNI